MSKCHVNLQATFNALPKWIKHVKENTMPNAKLMLVGSKCELRAKQTNDDDAVDFLEAKVNICTLINIIDLVDPISLY